MAHYPRQRNRFQKLAESGTDADAEQCRPSGGVARAKRRARAAALPLEPPHGTFNVSVKFVELAKSAILHRDHARFAILYRLLWRLRGNHDLLGIATDPDVAQVMAMAKAVIATSTGCTPSSASARSAVNTNRISSPGSSRSTTSSNWPRRSSRAALPTCPGRSSHPTSARIGTAMLSRSRRVVVKAEAPTGRLEETWRRIRPDGFSGNPGAKSCDQVQTATKLHYNL